MRDLRGYHGKHRRQHAPVALIIRDHWASGRPGALQLNAAAATAVLASASLFAGTAAPASAAAQEPAPPSLSAVATAARYVHVRDGHFILDTRDAEDAGALAAGTSLVASLNRQLADPESSPAGTVLDAAQADSAKTYTLLPGVTLTVSSTEIQLNLTKEAVTETEDILGLSQGIASFVGAILGISQVPNGPEIASIVASSIGLGSDLFRFCVASDGSATFTIQLDGIIPIPSCSGISEALA